VERAEGTTLPQWPTRTVAVLSTVDPAPHAIPISAPVRADDRRVLFSLHRARDSLARLRERPEVALTVLAEGNLAFTVRGRARVVQEAMSGAPDYAPVELEVECVDDHRQPAFEVDAGVGRRWVDESEQRALGERVRAMRRLVAEVDPRTAS
jgi:pyridoxamine 5'-phosphate oxidase-like protein